MTAITARFSAAFAGPLGSGFNADGSAYAPATLDAAALGALIDSILPNVPTIDAETQAREAADTALGAEITTLGSNVTALGGAVGTAEAAVTALQSLTGDAAHGNAALGAAVTALQSLTGDPTHGNTILGTTVAALQSLTADQVHGNVGLDGRLKTIEGEIPDIVATTQSFGFGIAGYSVSIVDQTGALYFGVDVQGRVVNRTAYDPQTFDVPGVAYAVADGAGNMPFEIRTSSSIYAGKIEVDVPCWLDGPPGSRILKAYSDAAGEFVGSQGVYYDIVQAQSGSDSVSYVGRRMNAGVSLTERRHVALAPPSTLLPQYTALQYIPVYGESTSVGATATPPLSTVPLFPGRAVMPVGGVYPLQSVYPFDRDTDRLLKDEAMWGYTDLCESSYGIWGETVASQAARQMLIAGNCPANLGLLMAGHGHGGRTCASLMPGQAAAAGGNGNFWTYSNLIRSVEVYAAYARATGRVPLVPAVVFVQGVNDVNNPNYETQILALQAQLEGDIQAVTGQTQGVPLVISQVSTATAAIDATVMAQMQAAIDHPTKIILAGPEYDVAYSFATPIPVHFTNVGEARMGGKIGRALKGTLIDGIPYKPLYPLSAVRVGQDVTVNFHVPSPPIVLDTATVTDPGGLGVQWMDSAGTLHTPSAVTVVDATHVDVKLPSLPADAGNKLYFGIRQAGSTGSGPTAGPRTCNRDVAADTVFVGGQSYPLFNWCCISTVPFA